MQVQPLTVGPIVGYTTGEHVRLWGRGAYEEEMGVPRRCIGVARIRPAKARSWRAPRFVEMNPNFDMTSVIVFDELQPETHVEYQFGFFFSEVATRNLNAGLELDWSAIEPIRFRTASVNPEQARSFVFGSCRYLLKLFGGAWFDDRGDKTYRSILEQINSGRQVDAMLMLGDQIYADDMIFVGHDKTLTQFNQRYQDSFTQPYIRQLMSRVPTYMTLDDHEIEDGWPEKATAADWTTKYPAAIHSLLTYQFSHSPVYELNAQRQLTGVPDYLWYRFQDGCCDFFITDTRTERYLSSDQEARQIINDQQFDALTNWLADGSGRVKIIGSATLLFPDNHAGSADAWGGFLQQRTRLLDFIRHNQIRRVVVLSGDVHASMTAELAHQDDPDFKIISLVSSPFFWPYPHSRPQLFVLDGTLRTGGANSGYRVQNAGPLISTDNFTRVTVDLDGVVAEVFGRKGELLLTKQHRF